MKRILCVAFVLSAFATLVGTASAGETDGEIRFNVRVDMDGDATAVLDAISVEVFDSGGSEVFSTFCGDQERYGSGDGTLGANIDCAVPPDTYTIGLSGLPAGFYVHEARCRDQNLPPEAFANPESTFTMAPAGNVFCDILIAEFQNIYLDKVVRDPLQALDPGELADVSDFTLEVFDDSGTLIGTTIDASTTHCSFFLTDQCGVLEDIAPGDYRVGEVPVLGYVGSVSCSVIFAPAEMFSGQPAFTHGDHGLPTICTIQNDYWESQVNVTHVVVNDDTGTATSADFTAELFHDGELMFDQQCLADGSCFVTELPVGDYTAGASGPNGYTHSAVVTITDIDTEQIANSSASFTLGPSQSVEVVITSEDDPPDDDADGVLDTVDACPGTDLVGDAADPPSRWSRNRFWSDADGDFVNRRGRSSGIDVADTGGCSAEQIVDALRSGRRYQRFLARIYDRYGFSKGALRVWAHTH